MNPLMKYAIFASLLLVFSSCGNGANEFDASGTFEATEVVVSSEASGKILSLDVKEGDNLKAGAVYGLVDTVELTLQKEQLLAGIRASLSTKQDVAMQTASLRQQIATTISERERVKKLIAANAANTKQLDDMNSSVSVLSKQLDALENSLQQGNTVVDAQVATMQTQIAQIDDRLRRCRITSPISGTVLAKYAQSGELTAVGKPLFKIADIGDMCLRAYITAGQLTELKIGQKVMIYADSGEKGYKAYEGIVTWISDKSEFTPKTIQTRDERANLVYAVKISFYNDGYVKIGMYGDVDF